MIEKLKFSRNPNTIVTGYSLILIGILHLVIGFMTVGWDISNIVWSIIFTLFSSIYLFLGINHFFAMKRYYLIIDSEGLSIDRISRLYVKFDEIDSINDTKKCLILRLNSGKKKRIILIYLDVQNVKKLKSYFVIKLKTV